MLKSGEGQYLEISLLESALAYTVWESSSYFATKEIPEPLGSSHRLSAPYQALKTVDGFINIGAPNQSNYERLCKAIAREDLIDNKYFIDIASRLNNREKLEKELEKTLSKKKSNYWIKKLDDYGVPCGPINNIGEAWDDPQVIARNMKVTLEHPTAGKIENIGISPKLYKTPGRITRPAPILGEHSTEILEEYGYNKKTISDFIDKKVIIQN